LISLSRDESGTDIIRPTDQKGQRKYYPEYDEYHYSTQKDPRIQSEKNFISKLEHSKIAKLA
jgi:hypothetical protein